MHIEKIVSTLFLFAVFFSGYGQRVVSPDEMAKVYEEVKTPYKYGLVIAPDSEDCLIDCPTVFQFKNKWYMTYVKFNGDGKTLDGRGYETWIAQSDNLLAWETLGRVLSFNDGKWDADQRGGFPALADISWGGSSRLKSHKGNYWMTYMGNDKQGYEAQPLKIGLAWTKKKHLGRAVEWQSFNSPILSPDDSDAQWFERSTQYKSTVYLDKKKTLGAKFVMFYNAAGVNPENELKAERIGIALSDDLFHWKRFKNNPVFANEVKGTITGDAQIQKIGDLYVMFYFRAFEPTRNYKAFNTFACSYDLVNWYKWEGDDLIYSSEGFDARYAHKSYVVKHKGVVYHFYCAVNKDKQRGIAVATSQPMGHSKINFVAKW